MDVPGKPTPLRFRDIAREEFWIVARSFFAPVYGTLLVWRRLARLTRRVDRPAAGGRPLQPAE
ncbi:MAG: hypothetical protein JOZ90_02935 [Alphaproteobacteria bacterium]|nr:hypothetical protein [Alphaproteobacteria bacterium]MBV9370457.1 hypothetical protein [Alphaproteobacteria bacterium]MBV9900033.1 hypothetical protein [Alphaproteobacteria bacterium]